MDKKVRKQESWGIAVNRGLAQRARGSILRTAQMGRGGAHLQPKQSGGRTRRHGSSGVIPGYTRSLRLSYTKLYLRNKILIK